MAEEDKLSRSLGLPLLALYGLGNILGAGIYVLVGKVAGLAGLSTTLAFIMAMVVAGITAFSYMELSGRYPQSASVSIYLHKAFGKQWLSVSVGMLIVASGIASASALAQGFGGYLSSFVNVPVIISAISLILVIGAVALKGISESAKSAAVLTVIEVIGLLMVVWFGRSAFSNMQVGDILRIDPAYGVAGLIAGTFLAFYAFIGFEDMVNVAEEAKKPRVTMPLAILIALSASTLLYILVVYVATATVSPIELSESSAPLRLVLEKVSANNSFAIGLIGMVAAINGVIVQVIMCSRILYGLSKQGWIHKELSRVHIKFKTPVNATLLVVGLMILGTTFLSLVSLAQLTSLLVLIIFIFVNVSLIMIKKKEPDNTGYIVVPKAVPYVGAFLCISLVAYQLLNWL